MNSGAPPTGSTATRLPVAAAHRHVNAAGGARRYPRVRRHDGNQPDSLDGARDFIGSTARRGSPPDRHVEIVSFDAKAHFAARRRKSEVVPDRDHVGWRRIDDANVGVRRGAERDAALSPDRRRERELAAKERDGARVRAANRRRPAGNDAKHGRLASSPAGARWARQDSRRGPRTRIA